MSKYKVLMPLIERATEIKEASKEALSRGPKAFCSGTLRPCSAGSNCRHYGVHYCSTFKKHQKPCPHHTDHHFTCTRLDNGGDYSLEKQIS